MKYDSIAGFISETVLNLDMENLYIKPFMYSNDTLPDILISGIINGRGTTKILKATSEFAFEELEIFDFTVKKLDFGDFNNDGFMEYTFLSAESNGSIQIYSVINDQFTLKFDTVGIDVVDFVVKDADNDWFDDIILSVSEIGGDASYLLLSDGEFNFHKESIQDFGHFTSQKLLSGYVDIDSYNDFLFLGKYESNSSIFKYSPKSELPEKVSTYIEFEHVVEDIDLADFNSDGILDLLYRYDNELKINFTENEVFSIPYLEVFTHTLLGILIEMEI